MPAKRPANKGQPPPADKVNDDGRRVTRSNLKRSASSASLASTSTKQQKVRPQTPPPRHFARQNTEPRLEVGKPSTGRWTSTATPAKNKGSSSEPVTAAATNYHPATATPPRSAAPPPSATPRTTPSRIPIPAASAGAGAAAARLKRLQEFARADATAKQHQLQSSALKTIPAASAFVKIGTPPKKRKVEEDGDAQATFVKDTHATFMKDTNATFVKITQPTSSDIPTSTGTSSAAAAAASRTCPKTRAADYVSWVELHMPADTSTGHFVNPRKISEVRDWLVRNNGDDARVLLMIGPSGSGKTATICTLAKETGYTVREWINPVQSADSVWRTESTGPRQEQEEREIWFTARRQSQEEQFAEFLLRASTYNTIPLGRSTGQDGVASGGSNSSDPLVIVEDLPNVFYKKPEVLHEIIRNYRQFGGSPLVFIIPESTSSATGQYRLFPPALMAELGVTQITFNKVAPTFIVSYLNRICAAEKLSVDKDLVEEIALTANGDMRWAINNLEFRLHGTREDFRRKLFIPPKKKRKGETMKSKQAAAAARNAAGDNDYLRDESIFLFHALGKVLYAKRDIVKNPTEDALIGSSMEWARRPHPLNEDPDAIGDRVQVSPQTFFNFLGQNFLPFFTNIEEAARASEHLADAAEILTHWTADDSGKINEAKEQMGLSVAIRGLMHVNSNRPTSTFRKLRKPLFTDSNPELRDTIQALKSSFGNTGPVCQDFYSNELPFYRKLNANKFDVAQRKLIKQVGIMDHAPQMQRQSDVLPDKDVVIEDTDVLPEFAEFELEEKGRLTMKPQSGGFKVTDEKLAKPAAPVDEFVIEDYDDEL